LSDVHTIFLLKFFAKLTNYKSKFEKVDDMFWI